MHPGRVHCKTHTGRRRLRGSPPRVEATRGFLRKKRHLKPALVSRAVSVPLRRGSLEAPVGEAMRGGAATNDSGRKSESLWRRCLPSLVLEPLRRETSGAWTCMQV